MSDIAPTLCDQIMTVLTGVSEPLKAKEISDRLQRQFGASTTTTDINRFLYGSLSARVSKDRENRWKLVGSNGSSILPAAEPIPPLDSQSASPRCPECGGDMAKRTASRGHNAGGSFWGCGSFPRCRGTRSIENSESASRTVSHAAAAALPRRMVRRCGDEHHQLLTFECVGIGRGIAADLAFAGMNSVSARALSQWELRLPLAAATLQNADEAQWPAIVEKILKRGRLAPLHPELDKAIAATVGIQPPSLAEAADALQAVATADRVGPTWSGGFDSDEERLFLELLETQGLGFLKGWLHHQVALGSLTGNETDISSNQRLDFLLAHPSAPPICIEIDGVQHQSSVVADNRRDDRLRSHGYAIYRIQAAEIRAGRGEGLNLLLQGLWHLTPSDLQPTPTIPYVQLCKSAHQIQLALWQAIASKVITAGSRCRVYLHVAADPLGSLQRQTFASVIDDLNRLIADVAELYQEPGSTTSFEVATTADSADVAICISAAPLPLTIPALWIRDVYYPVTLAMDTACAFRPTDAVALKPVCERMLYRIYGFKEFKEGQFESMARCLAGEEAIVLLPTGAGKSVIFQLTSLLRAGVCIVIDPILSLIDDQIENLRLVGIDRAIQITSASDANSRSAAMEGLARGEYLFCYIAPERLQQQEFRESLRTLTTHSAVALIAIDKAHCISE